MSGLSVHSQLVASCGVMRGLKSKINYVFGRNDTNYKSVHLKDV